MEFLDTNIILRYLTKDDPVKAERCYELFQKVKRKEIQVVTSESVLAEVVYVLSSRALYNQPRENIRALLIPLVSWSGLKIAHRRAFLHALELYATTNLDFEDALSVAHMERLKINTILSYDEDFDRIKGIERREP
ncbi:MAG: type II toxin-antitoxin system VapC family toxin [Chloroflexi bacterium]|nr:type II toxin-antitoxin system VapC family toxin [Chloroflexota bacterium]